MGRFLRETVWVIRTWIALSPLQRAVLVRSLAVVTDPMFGDARHAVRLTAVTLGLNKPHTWDELMQTVKSQPAWAENQWRHVHALKLLHKRVTHANRRLTNPDLNLMTELAYVSYAIQPRD